MAGTWSESTFQDLQNILICFRYLLVKMIGFYQREWKSWVIFCYVGKKEFAKGTTGIGSSLSKPVSLWLILFLGFKVNGCTRLEWPSPLISHSLGLWSDHSTLVASSLARGHRYTFLTLLLHGPHGHSGRRKCMQGCGRTAAEAQVAMQRHPTCWKGSTAPER